MSPSVGRVWRGLRDRLADRGIGSATLDARLLTGHVLAMDETRLIASETDPFPSGRIAALEALALRRLAGEPVARILGVREFYGLSFGLNAATLVPRPETEMLVDFGLGVLGTRSRPRILDLGTGSGCIALALLANLDDATAIGVDVSSEALDQARANAKTFRLAERFETALGSWFAPIGDRSFDLIVSNPPYIASAVIETLDPGVRSFDPMAALDGGPDGLDPYRVIAGRALSHLAAEGWLALEIGYDQGHMLVQLLKEAGFSDIALSSDLAGHDRMVTARAPR